MLLPDGELVRSKTDPTVYLISNKQRRPFVNIQALTELGYDIKNVIITTDDAVNIHELGTVISESF